MYAIIKTKLRNVTLTIEEELARWARIEAARQEMSVSRFLVAVLKKERVAKDNYATAKKRALGRKAFLKTDRKYLSGEEAHERTGARCYECISVRRRYGSP